MQSIFFFGVWSFCVQQLGYPNFQSDVFSITSCLIPGGKKKLLPSSLNNITNILSVCAGIFVVVSFLSSFLEFTSIILFVQVGLLFFWSFCVQQLRHPNFHNAIFSTASLFDLRWGKNIFHHPSSMSSLTFFLFVQVVLLFFLEVLCSAVEAPKLSV